MRDFHRIVIDLVQKNYHNSAFHVQPIPRHPKSSKYLVSRCLGPLKTFSGDVWGFKHLLTRCLDVEGINEKPGFVETSSNKPRSVRWLVAVLNSEGLGGLGMLAANELAIAGKVGLGEDDDGDGKDLESSSNFFSKHFHSWI